MAKNFRFVKFYMQKEEANNTTYWSNVRSISYGRKSFCNTFNNETKEFEKGVLLKVI